MPKHAYINDRAEITFFDIKESAQWQRLKEQNRGRRIRIEWDDEPLQEKRTASQNNSLHLYFEHVADALNSAGLTMRKTLSHYKIDIEWSKETVKEVIWKPAQAAITGKPSTTQLNKQEEITKIWETVNRFLAELKVESVPFPSFDPTYRDNAPLKSDPLPNN